MKKYVYAFGGGTADGDGKMKDVLGGKGAGLAEMSRAGVPVPPGFTISTEVCNIYFQNKNNVPEGDRAKRSRTRSPSSKQQMGKKLGDAADPLLLSVRSGAKFSMPGMMNTILNLGLNDETVEGLAKQERQSALRLRLLSPLHPDVRRSGARHRHAQVRPHLRRAQEEGEGQAGYRSHRRRPESHHRRLQEAGARRKPASRFPQDAREQLAMSRDAVFRSWWGNERASLPQMEKIPDDIGTAANVQAMVFGNMGETSGTGVGFTRNPGHRRKGVLGRVPGERAGRRRGGRHPHAAADRRPRRRDARRLSTSFARSPRTSKSTTATCRISSSPSRTASCSCCRPATASAPARRRVRVAVDMVKEGLIDKKEAVLRVAPQQLDQLLHPVFDHGLAQEADQARQRHRRIARRGGRPRGFHRR